MTTVTISLSGELEDFVKEQARLRSLEDPGEFVLALLQDVQRRADAELDGLLQEAMDSGEDIEVNHQFWSDLGVEVRQMIETRKKKSA